MKSNILINWDKHENEGLLNCLDAYKRIEMPLTESQRQGLSDLLLLEENVIILIPLAKSLIKNITTISDAEEALNVVLTHGSDAAAILNKKLVTKEIIFKYLNRNHVPVESNVTKANLIAKTLNYWNTSPPSHQGVSQSPDINVLSTLSREPSVDEVAHAFAKWFFTKYNTNSLTEGDFWPDADLKLRITAIDGSEDNISNDAKSMISLLMEKKMQFGFYFNLNASESGIQGCMDIHGMLLVLTCGTLHTNEACVGVFENLFGLLRDPFQDNNWKIKTLRSLLRSQKVEDMPTIDNSASLKVTLAIDQNNGEYG